MAAFNVLAEELMLAMVPPLMFTRAALLRDVALESNTVPPFRPVFSVPKKAVLPLPARRVRMPDWSAFKIPAAVVEMSAVMSKFPTPANCKVFAPMVRLLCPESVDAELLLVQVWFAPTVTLALFMRSKVTLPALAAIVIPPAPMVIVLLFVVDD